MSATIEVSCETHPRYKGIHLPSTEKDCNCLFLYILLHERWRLVGFAKSQTLRIVEAGDE
jgi:hypothetical protein